MPATRSRRIRPERLGERSVGLVADFGEVLRGTAGLPASRGCCRPMPGMRTAAQRFDAGLLQRIVGGAGFGLGGRALAVRFGIVAGEPHGHGVALAAGNGDVAPRRQARQVGEPRLVGGEDRPVGREAHLELALVADGAHRRAHSRLERLRWCRACSAYYCCAAAGPSVNSIGVFDGRFDERDQQEHRPGELGVAPLGVGGELGFGRGPLIYRDIGKAQVAERVLSMVPMER